MKKCSHCGLEKPLSEFGIRNRKTKGGTTISYNCYCKLCNSERAKAKYYSSKENALKCVYRFLNQDNKVLYVGKTECLRTRAKQHFSKRSPLFINFENEEGVRLQYITMESTALMYIKEVYYINLYKPKYNTQYNYDEFSVVISDFKNDEWIDYSVEDKIKLPDTIGICKGKAVDIKTLATENIKSIFKRKRGNKYYVYVEIKDNRGKVKQILKGSFVEEQDANTLLDALKTTLKPK